MLLQQCVIRGATILCCCLRLRSNDFVLLLRCVISPTTRQETVRSRCTHNTANGEEQHFCVAPAMCYQPHDTANRELRDVPKTRQTVEEQHFCVAPAMCYQLTTRQTMEEQHFCVAPARTTTTTRQTVEEQHFCVAPAPCRTLLSLGQGFSATIMQFLGMEMQLF
jgi:hypothetical protein